MNHDDRGKGAHSAIEAALAIVFVRPSYTNRQGYVLPPLRDWKASEHAGGDQATDNPSIADAKMFG